MKMLIEIQGNKPLSAYGDNHVIAYDSNKNSYYVTTAESFFAGQNEKIKDLLDKITAFEGKFNALKEEVNKFEAGILNRVNNFQQENTNKYNNFLQTYQETNARLIAMVRELVGANNNEEE